jgi:hypothetical protein
MRFSRTRLTDTVHRRNHRHLSTVAADRPHRSGPPSGSGRGPAECAVVNVVQKMLGSLPATAEHSRRIGTTEIDAMCPVRDLAQLTQVQGIEALIANRLSSPTAMVQVSDWAQDWAVEEVYGFLGA